MVMGESKVNQSTHPQIHEDRAFKHLRCLGFMHTVMIYLVICFTTIYKFAKENSGPLKPGVQNVEGTVKTVIGPVYHKFQHVPFEALMFVDQKVDEMLIKVNYHMPLVMKRVSSQAMFTAQEAQEVARELAYGVQRDGMINTTKNIIKTMYSKYEPIAKELYATYEPVARKYSTLIWRSMNRLPFFPQMAHMVLPTIIYWVDKYNKAVYYSMDKGYPAAQYLPLVPVKKITKVFRRGPIGPIDKRRITIVT